MDVTSPVYPRHDSSASMYALQHNFQPDLTMHAMSHVPSRAMHAQDQSGSAGTRKEPITTISTPPHAQDLSAVRVEALFMELIREQRRQQRFITTVVIVFGGFVVLILLVLLAFALFAGLRSRVQPGPMLSPYGYPLLPSLPMGPWISHQPALQSALPGSMWASRVANDVAPVDSQ